MFSTLEIPAVFTEAAGARLGKVGTTCRKVSYRDLSRKQTLVATY